MDVAKTCKYDWKCTFSLLDGCLLRTFSLAVSYFNYKSMKTTGTLIATNKLKVNQFRIIKFKSVETLNFITWKGTDHSNQEGNTKIKPSYAFQCFSPGVEIRIFIQFGTGSHIFLKLLVCSVNNDILLIIHVAFIILQMSDFLRLALDVYVFTRYGHNTRKIQT